MQRGGSTARKENERHIWWYIRYARDKFQLPNRSIPQAIKTRIQIHHGTHSNRQQCDNGGAHEITERCGNDTSIRCTCFAQRLQQANIHPWKHVLDNEISENMKQHIKEKYKFELKMVPPGCHQRNAAEVAIRNFKSHFLSVLAGTAESFPLHLWDRLLPQTKITLNLLRQSNATPTVSAYTHLSGPFYYNKMPLAPMGCKVQIHENVVVPFCRWMVFINVTRTLHSPQLLCQNNPGGKSHRHHPIQAQ